MLESADKVVDGLAITVKITGAESGIIVLEDNKLELVPVLSEAIDKHAMKDKLGVTVCKTKYPQGGEKSLIQAAVGREIPAGGLPADAGCVVDNVGTLVAISEAFREGKPLIDRSFTRLLAAKILQALSYRKRSRRWGRMSLPDVRIWSRCLSPAAYLPHV